MTLKERLNDDMKSAMKQKEESRLAAVRQIRGAVKNKEIELMRELKDEDIFKVIGTLIKQHKESIEMFEKGGRTELMQKEQAELAVLESYLPQQMGEDEVRALVREAIQAVGATSAKEIGAVMKYVMPKTQGRADGKLINQLAREMLPA